MNSDTSPALNTEARAMLTDRCYGFVMTLALLGGIITQAFIPFTDVHVYFMECAVLAIIVLADALHRRTNIVKALGYFLASLVLAPLAVARWYADRPLRHDETRKGGFHTNFFNAFALLTLMFTGVSAACNFLAFGPDRGFELIINGGFAVVGTALVMALAAKQDMVLEKGPKSLSKNAESSKVE